MLRRWLILFMVLWLPLQAFAASMPVCVHALVPTDAAAAGDSPPCHRVKSSEPMHADSVADMVCDDCESCHAVGASALPLDRRTPGGERVSLYEAVAPLAALPLLVPPPTPPPTI